MSGEETGLVGIIDVRVEIFGWEMTEKDVDTGAVCFAIELLLAFFDTSRHFLVGEDFFSVLTSFRD
jgi:hypothetical protein